jgi:hypothetical protein
VTSPAGTTAAAVRELEDHKVRAAFLIALEAAANWPHWPAAVVVTGIQHDDNGFRIFRNGLRQIAVLTAAPMLDVSMPAAGLLPEHLS